MEVLMWRWVTIIPPYPACRRNACGYSGTNLSLGDIDTGTWSSGLGFDASLTTLLCKTVIVAKSKEMKSGSILTEYSKKCYGSKRVFANDDDEEGEKPGSWVTL
jgi:hypothetical protein